MFQKPVIINILLWTLLFTLVGVSVISNVPISGVLITGCVIGTVLVTSISYRHIFTDTEDIRSKAISVWRLWKPLLVLTIATFGGFVFLWTYSNIGSLAIANGVILILLLYSVLYLALINE